MKGKKLLTVILSTMLVFSSSASVFAYETNPTSKEGKNISSKNNMKGGDFNKYENVFKAVAADKVVSTPKACTTGKDAKIVKDSIKSKDYNLGKDANIGSAIRAAQAKAETKVKDPVKVTPPKVEITQALKDQIKAEYTAMRATELANKATFVSAVSKKNQVVSYIYKVAEGKITYTDAQLTQLDTLSVTFVTDIKAVTDATVAIKTAENAVKASAKTKNYDAVLAGLKAEAAARVTRGTALTKINTDLDNFLLVLVQGQAVLPTPVTPATKPTVVPTV